MPFPFPHTSRFATFLHLLILNCQNRKLLIILLHPLRLPTSPHFRSPSLLILVSLCCAFRNSYPWVAMGCSLETALERRIHPSFFERSTSGFWKRPMTWIHLAASCIPQDALSWPLVWVDSVMAWLVQWMCHQLPISGCSVELQFGAFYWRWLTFCFDAFGVLCCAVCSVHEAVSPNVPGWLRGYTLCWCDNIHTTSCHPL